MPQTVAPPAALETHDVMETVHAPTPQLARREAVRLPSARWTERILLGVAAVFLILHFVHLKADFPNNSQWKDWAKYTDEGWYGDAAIRHYLLGHWNVPGDFNPAAALPVWPALELILFRFTGVSLVAARAMSVCVFGLTLLALYRLMRLWSGASGLRASEASALRAPDGFGLRASPTSGTRASCDACAASDANSALKTDAGWNLAPSLAVGLLAASPFCFVFVRLAILEPLLVLLTTLALIAATHAGRAAAVEADGGGWTVSRRAVGWAVTLGLLLPLSILTKTTALFLFPAVLWMLYAGCAYRWRAFVPAAAISGGTAALLWLGYYVFFVRPRFQVDYRYLFSANTYTGFRWATLGSLLLDTMNDAVWVGRPLFLLSLTALAWALIRLATAGAKRTPLPTALLLWVLGYGAFLTYHANLQPRYYLMIAPPLTALVALAFQWLVWRARQTRGIMRVTLVGLGSLAIAYTGLRAAVHTVYFVLHPEYTWISAAARVRDIVTREARTGHPPLVLSISGSEMTLMTGIPSICDDFGTLNLVDRVAKYRPGWFATWNNMEDDKMEALSPMYRVQRVTTIPAFDDPDRNLLILYRLDPLPTPGAYSSRGRRRRPVFTPRALRTPVASRTARVPGGTAAETNPR